MRKYPRGAKDGVTVGHFGLVVDTEEQLQKTASALRERGLCPERKEDRFWLLDPDLSAWEIFIKP